MSLRGQIHVPLHAFIGPLPRNGALACFAHGRCAWLARACDAGDCTLVSARIDFPLKPRVPEGTLGMLVTLQGAWYAHIRRVSGPDLNIPSVTAVLPRTHFPGRSAAALQQPAGVESVWHTLIVRGALP